MQVCMKLVIFDEYLVIHCWMLTCDHHRTTVLAYRTWVTDDVDDHCKCSKQYPLMNGTAMHQWTLFMTQATETTSKTRVQKTILTRYLEINKAIATERGELCPDDKSTVMQTFHAKRWHVRRDKSVPEHIQRYIPTKNYSGWWYVRQNAP